jgi:hypothetical protein
MHTDSRPQARAHYAHARIRTRTHTHVQVRFAGGARKERANRRRLPIAGQGFPLYAPSSLRHRYIATCECSDDANNRAENCERLFLSRRKRRTCTESKGEGARGPSRPSIFLRRPVLVTLALRLRLRLALAANQPILPFPCRSQCNRNEFLFCHSVQRLVCRYARRFSRFDGPHFLPAVATRGAARVPSRIMLGLISVRGGPTPPHPRGPISR